MSGFDFEEVQYDGDNEDPVFHPKNHNMPPEEIHETSDLDIDFEEDAKITVNEDGLARVSKLSNEYRELKDEIAVVEGKLESLKARYDQVRFDELPNAMAAANMDEIKTGGVKISVSPFVRASLVKDQDERRKAADWLRREGRGAIIKRKVGVALGVGNDEAASKAMEELKKALPGVMVTDELDVHHSTLSSTIREMMEDGTEIPTDGSEIGMNLFTGREAKISKAKR